MAVTVRMPTSQQKTTSLDRLEPESNKNTSPSHTSTDLFARSLALAAAKEVGWAWLGSIAAGFPNLRQGNRKKARESQHNSGLQDFELSARAAGQGSVLMWASAFFPDRVGCCRASGSSSELHSVRFQSWVIRAQITV